MKKRISAVVATAIALVVVTATAAFAHFVTIYNGNDIATVRSDHHGGTVNDNECDSNRVYLDILFTNFETRRVVGNNCSEPTKTFETVNTMWQVWFCEDKGEGYNDSDDYCVVKSKDDL